MSALIRDGKFAVIYSSDSGWSTWAGDDYDWKEMATDRQLAEFILAEKYDEAEKYAEAKWPRMYHFVLSGCKVKWLPLGTLFRIDDCVGFEYVAIYNPINYHTVTGEES